ncbi:MAG TPA: alkaline shock response membrane anchor protein AmaP [Ktedonobacterales bacterium]
MLNAINRFILLLLSLVVVVFAAVALLLMGDLIRPESVSPGGVLLGQWQFFAGLRGQDFTNVVVVCALLMGAGLLFLAMELPPWRSTGAASSAYVLLHDELGQVTVARRSVRDLVRYEASSVPGVMEVRPDVRDGPKGRGVRVSTRIALASDADASSVKAELQQKIRASVQRHFGLSVAGVRIGRLKVSADDEALRRGVGFSEQAVPDAEEV